MRVAACIFAALCLSAATPESALWSLRPIVRVVAPEVRNPNWVRTPIDRFVLARLEREGLAPASEADPATLIRRVTLDLTGLPPSPEQLEAFLADREPGAWLRLVDGLLASPHYGEKWGRHWLDQARYADSDGYRGDAFRPYAWRWRHWVVDALNRDMPFDRFTMEQIAGDLIPGAHVATGFQRNTLTNREGGTDPEQFRVEAVIDRTNTVGTVWLGLTVGCAQCHDHKYDPITQKDYYRLLAFFNTAEEWTIDAPLAGEWGPHSVARPEYDRRRAELLHARGVAPLQDEWEKRLVEVAANPGKWLDWDHAFDDLRTALSDGEKILRTAPERRDRRQRKMLTDYFLANYHRVIPAKRAEELQFEALRKELAKLDEALPALSEAAVIREETPRRATHIFARGDFRSPGDPVLPGTPAILHPLHADPLHADSPTRLDLARWLVSPDNTLTARAVVNRVWEQYFGRGLAKTSENFGTQGEGPSHPELLDWLASEFMQSGWRMKHLHRLIATSAVYRQSSKIRPDLLTRDPDNMLLARQSRARLQAELIRDGALAASGLLDRTIGGPGAASGYRRGMYMQRFRNKPHPFLANFDAPNGYAPVCRRTHSTTPLQSLNLLNDPVFAEAAQALGLRVMREAEGFGARLRRAFLLTVARAPSALEEEDLGAWFVRQTTLLGERPKAVDQIVPSEATVEAAAWAGLASVLLNTAEFITRE